ncbi:MAG: methionine synthase [Peptococcaceae bacterium]|nr:methionine synthase [Peptococcaceae bacterium]
MNKNLLQQQLAKKILILDGAMGTMLQQMGLQTGDFGGESREGCNEILNLTRPDIVKSIHERYLQAGADIIETNTFGATRIVLAEYGLADKDIEINKAAALLACEAAARWSSPQQPRFVAGSMGPTIKMLSLTGGLTFAELAEAYYRQALGLLAGGVNLLLLETCQDTLNVKAAGLGINRAFTKLGIRVPLIISCTVEPSGTMLAGQNIEAFYVSVEHLKPLAIGLNCGTGADLMHDSLRTLHELASCAVCCYPNAGLPDEEGKYRETPEQFASKIMKYAANGWLNIAGGCCGTTDYHVKALADVLADYRPRKVDKDKALKSCVSGLEVVWPEEDNRPLLVGERCNVIGSRKFKEIITQGRYEEGAELAKVQVKKGAQIIDICVANPDSDELQDMEAFLPHVVNRIKAPLMLDSTDPRVLESGLTFCQGKAIINSINLEHGLKRFDEVVPLIKSYGAAVVVGTIDEQGMAVTRKRKLAVAERSYDLLVHKYGLRPQDIIFDPLTFPVGTGDSKYQGSAVETIEGLRLIKQKMPECKTILGISNVSFGLPAAGREVLNSVFVYLNTLAGLDYAIVNAEKLKRYATLPSEEKKLAEDLLLNTNQQTLKAFTDFYREKAADATPDKVKAKPRLTLEERLSGYIVEGMKEGLVEDLQEALKTYSPLQLINGPLMRGMEKVGDLFNQNQLIVAEVLQSAEVMKAAVNILEPYMEKAEQAVKGKALLATVKGDVHDIGKNLVDIILSNNGYQVINLGVKVSSEQLIEACRLEKPDVIGLSGLLVKSVQQMLITAQDLRDAGFDIPLILGGAALSRKFTEEKIAPEYRGPVIYARDAMEGLTLLNNLLASRSPDENLQAGDKLLKKAVAAELKEPSNKREISLDSKTGKKEDQENVSPDHLNPSHERKLLRDYALAKLIPYLNFNKIYRKYLGVKANNQSTKVEEYKQFVTEFLEEIQDKKIITACGVYSFLPAYSEGESIYILDPTSLDPASKSQHSSGQRRVLEEFTFPRQKKREGLCLADFIRPLGQEKPDILALFALSTGIGVREKADQYKENGEYLKSIFLQALALELAEAFAEHLHAEIRKIWRIPPDQGIRVSPGYPIFPAIEDQTKIFRLLKPQEVGITLTEGMMMDPEASVSGIIIGSPQARIFKC